MRDIYPVREQIGDLASAEIEISAETPILLGIPRTPLGGTDVAVPIEICGLGSERLGSFQQVHRIAMPPGSHHGNFAQLVGLEVFVASLQVSGPGTLLHANLKNFLLFASGLYNSGAFF